jgi:hypothetical protein
VADVQVNVDYIGLFDLLFDDTSYDLLSGSLGSVHEEVAERIETELGDRIGFDPGVADRVLDGFLPIPLTDPALAPTQPFHPAPR